ncbi:hypothetical protein EV363DRAFT_1158634 [Boletus edulis]|nr:hypothetical protein EV363DRAFT_1158634 [Boletus edulis]
MAGIVKVTIMYYSAKHDQIATLTTASSELIFIKRDLINLWVHSPPQENIWCINRSFILQWLSVGTDLLHTQWCKLCSNNLGMLRLREHFSIESIMMKQEGILICATTGNKQTLQDVPSGTLVETLGDHSQETEHQAVLVLEFGEMTLQPNPTPLSASLCLGSGLSLASALCTP